MKTMRRFLSAAFFTAAVAEVPPLYGDPRANPTCANMFGNSTQWRATDKFSLDARTREDVKFNRSQPFLAGQLGPQGTCLGQSQNYTNIVYRQIPKSGSQAISKLIKAFPGKLQCESKSKPYGASVVPILFTFVRHPYSRLVSGFHTILTFMTECNPYKDLLKWNAHKKTCMKLQRLPFWLAFAAMSDTPYPHKPIGNLTEDEVRLVFRLFVRDILDAPPVNNESGRNGLEPVMHHIHSQVRTSFPNAPSIFTFTRRTPHRLQMYFLGLRASFGNVCSGGRVTPPRGRVQVCNRPMNFVGKLEAIDKHAPLLLEFLARESPENLGPTLESWETGDLAMHAAVSRDSQAERYVDLGGKLFEVT